MEQVSFELYESSLFRPEECDDNHRRMAVVKRKLAGVMRQALTLRQEEMVRMYYYQQKKIPQIARELGVNKSTVSRTIKRGIQNIRTQMKHCRLR